MSGNALDRRGLWILHTRAAKQNDERLKRRKENKRASRWCRTGADWLGAPADLPFGAAGRRHHPTPRPPGGSSSERLSLRPAPNVKCTFSVGLSCALSHVWRIPGSCPLDANSIP